MLITIVSFIREYYSADVSTRPRAPSEFMRSALQATWYCQPVKPSRSILKETFFSGMGDFAFRVRLLHETYAENYPPGPYVRARARSNKTEAR